MAFHPNPGDRLQINNTAYRVGNHPAAPGLAYAQAGRQGVVYQLIPEDGEMGAAVALKVFLPKYRIPSYVHLAQMMENFSGIRGLQVCKREVLTPERNSGLIAEHPDLLYAVLMPWIEGSTWLDVLAGEEPFSRRDSLNAAKALAAAGSAMEQRGIAHSDLSAPNVMFLKGSGYAGIELVDVEQLYSPRLDPPAFHLTGSPGYASYRISQESLPPWNAYADRLPGSIMIAEMLGWCDEEIRGAAWGESYFDPQEIQEAGPRFTLLMEALERNFGKGPAELLARAWNSQDIRSCPSFGEWVVALSAVRTDWEQEPGSIEAQGLFQDAEAKVASVAGPFGSETDAASLPDTSIYGEEAKAARAMEQARAAEKDGRADEALAGYQEALRLSFPGSPLHAELNAAVTGFAEAEIAKRETGAAKQGIKPAKEGRSNRLLLGGAAAILFVMAMVLLGMQNGWFKSDQKLASPAAAAPAVAPSNPSKQEDRQAEAERQAREEAAKQAEADKLAKEKAEREAKELAAAKKAALQKQYNDQAKYDLYLVWKKNKEDELAKQKAEQQAAEHQAALKLEQEKADNERKAKELQAVRDQKMVKLIAYYNSAYNAQKTGNTDRAGNYAKDFIAIYNTDAQYFVKTAPIGKRVGHVYRFLQDSDYKLPNV